MTNEQKVVELMNSGVDTRPALELMAEWKDEQIKYIIDQATEDLITILRGAAIFSKESINKCAKNFRNNLIEEYNSENKD